jgi:hypothetical protein
VSEKTTYQVLLEMAPEDKRGEIEKILRNYKQVENENDGLFQVIMVMGIYQNFLSKIPADIKNAVRESTFEVVEINARIERNLKIFMIAIYIGLAIFAVFLFYYSTITFQESSNRKMKMHSPISESQAGIKKTEEGDALEDFRTLVERSKVE